MSRAAGEERLVLGPMLGHLPAEQWRDFYFRIADESAFDVVCLGEPVCGKRARVLADQVPPVEERLERAGKDIVNSTLALVTGKRDLDALALSCAREDRMTEANDIAAVSMLRGRPFTVGPFVNVYNEDTLKLLAGRGAIRVCPPAELTQSSLRALAAAGACDIEAQVFGRVPLAISSRCYHARAHGLNRDHCRQVCAADPDGLAADTLDGEPFVAVSGHVVMSSALINRLGDLGELRKCGVRHFRLHPNGTDMVAVAELFRAVLDARLDPAAASHRLQECTGGGLLSPGFPAAPAGRGPDGGRGTAP